jgi:Kef-type K+ transport system membrane component KefB
VSAAIEAFLVRDLFAAIFFFLAGVEIDPASLVPALLLAGGLGVVTTLTKVLTGCWAPGQQ